MLPVMKTLTVNEAQGRLAEIIADVNNGELIVLKSGEQKVTLRPGLPIDPNLDSPELEEELLKGIDEPAAPYSTDDLDGACAAAARRLRKK
jgi:hypothetical protein